MKTRIFQITVLALLLLPALIMFGGQVRIAWQASPSATSETNLVYVVYGHTNTLSETNLWQALIRANVGTNQTLRLYFTNSGNWFVRVTASVGGVESEPSNELALIVSESPGTVATVAVQYTFDLTNGATWFPAGNIFLRMLPNP